MNWTKFIRFSWLILTLILASSLFAYVGSVYAFEQYNDPANTDASSTIGEGGENDGHIHMGVDGTPTPSPTPPPGGIIVSRSEFDPPAIDGAFSAGEWTNSQLLIESPIHTYVYFTNDDDFLYVCVDAANAAVGDFTEDVSDHCDLVFDTGNDEAWTQGNEDYFHITGGGTKEHNVASATPYQWTNHCNFDAHVGLEGAAGFGASPTSGTDHRIYEFKIPLSLLGASPGATIGFSSPTGAPGEPESIPYDADTGRHNVWPPGAEWGDLGTWGDLLLAAPALTGVPTLSQWGLIGMGILLAAFLIWTVRRRWAVSAGRSQGE